MSEGGGERGNWQGELFDHACQKLLKELGFKEIFRGKHGIDMLAATPAGSPAKFLPPPPLPSGNIAFEFTSQQDSPSARTEELEKKIDEIKKKGTYQVDGGIVLADVRVAEKLFPQSGQTFLWDVRDAALLTSKVLTARLLRAKGRNPIERALRDTVTYLWCLETKSEFSKAQTILFEHGQAGDISSDEIERLLTEFCSKVESEAGNLGMFPLQIEVEIRSRKFTTKGVEERLDQFLQDKSQEDRIVYTSAGLTSFFVAPWAFGCTTNI